MDKSMHIAIGYPRAFPYGGHGYMSEKAKSGEQQIQAPPSDESPLPVTVGPYGILLVPAVIGSIGSFLLALNTCKTPVEYSREVRKKEWILVAYSAMATFSFGIFVYSTVKFYITNILKSFFPVAIGLLSLFILYGTVYLLIYRMDPDSFSDSVGDDFISQTINFIYFSIATFSTGSIENLTPHTLPTRTIVIIEFMVNIFIFLLGFSIILSSF